MPTLQRLGTESLTRRVAPKENAPKLTPFLLDGTNSELVLNNFYEMDEELLKFCLFLCRKKYLISIILTPQ